MSRAILLIVSVLALGALTASSSPVRAEAGVYSYCGKYKHHLEEYAWHWCTNHHGNRYYGYNEAIASYNPNAQFNVCERLDYANTMVEVAGWGCAFGAYVARQYAVSLWCCFKTIGRVGWLRYTQPSGSTRFMSGDSFD